MIIATIQGASAKQSYRYITAVDGEIIPQEKQRKFINKLFDDGEEVSMNKEEYLKLENGKLACAIFHPQKDDIGRKRYALLVWDEDTNEELIEQTIKIMGLELVRFDELKRDYERSLNQKKTQALFNKIIAIGLGVIVLAGIVILLRK